jgi:pimeloyl-ACP methyl ester carboxylesterase
MNDAPSHTELVTIDAYGRHSRAKFAAAPDGRAILFVHGFLGKALETWYRFPMLLPDVASCAGVDLYFYGFDTGSRSANVLATQLRELLKALLSPGIGRLIDVAEGTDTLRRGEAFRYERITIAAHSLGAVVVRRALLDLAREIDDAALARVRLVLFAPAHMGGDIIALARLAMQPLPFPPFEAAARWKFPVLGDLDPERSKMLPLLQTHTAAQLTAARAARTTTAHLIAERVIHAEFDGGRVVSDNQFCDDPPMTLFEGATHFSVCKPWSETSFPLVELLKHV